MARNKIVSITARYDYYLQAQERELKRLEEGNTENNMRNGRRVALQTIISDLQLYKTLYTPVDQRTIHNLLQTLDSHIGTVQDTYRMTGDADTRNALHGQYAEYLRQREQIRNLLTPMKERAK